MICKNAIPAIQPTTIMSSDRHLGISRLFFLLQTGGVVVMLWILFPLVDWLRFAGSLPSGPAFDATLLLLGSALLEYLTRDPEAKRIGGLSRRRLTAVSHRQTLFSLVAILGAMVMFKNDSLSRLFLVSFFASYFCWVTWTNHFGFRLLHRAFLRLEARRLPDEVSPEKAMATDHHAPRESISVAPERRRRLPASPRSAGG